MFLNLIRDRLSERKQIVPGIGLCDIVLIGDQVSPMAVGEHIVDGEFPYELLCGLSLRLHFLVIAPSRIFAFYDPICALIVKGDEVWELAILWRVVDVCLHERVQPVPPDNVGRRVE